MITVEVPGQQRLSLPEHLLDNLRMVHGRHQVNRWIESLGSLIATVLNEHETLIVPGDPPLSYHLVVFAERRTGVQVAIKCTVPNHEQPPEVAAVHALSDAGIGPRLIQSDLDRGVIVMERVQPGDTLPTGLPTLAEDAQIAEQLARLSVRIATEADVAPWQETLVPVHDYSSAIGEVDHGSALWAAHMTDIERALALREQLLAEASPVLLHGDLHHYNVLSCARHGLRVIDPKGLIGPAGYDFGAFTYNPVGISQHPDLAALERQRVDIWTSVTGLPWETVRSWGYVAAVLSASWSGKGGAIAWQHAMTIAETLRDLDPPLNQRHH